MNMYIVVIILTSFALTFFSSRPLQAQDEVQGALDNPLPGSIQSGIGVVGGWICDAERVDIMIDETTFEAAYGTSREDTRSVCNDADNGFGLLVNWNLFRCGEHTVRVLADGVEALSATVTVKTFGLEFLTGAEGWCTLADFPQEGNQVSIHWQESLQNFIIGEGSGVGNGSSSPFGALDNPQPGSSQSGTGVVAGWVCDAERVDIVINETAFEAAYGTSREDTRSVCNDADNGFGLLVNWNLFGNGTHTVRVLADGEEVASAAITITTLGSEIVSDIDGWCTVKNFPQEGLDVQLHWQAGLQNFVVENVSVGGDPIEDISVALSGSLFNNSVERQPITNASVSVGGGGEVEVDESGQFSLDVPFCSGPPIIFTFDEERQNISEGGKNIYRLTFTELEGLSASSANSLADTVIAAAVTAPSVDFFADPVAAASETPGVTVTPTLASPGGAATILAPQDEEVITCTEPLPTDCRFLVEGVASPELGQLGTEFNLFVSVTPITSGSGGTSPQFPPVSVDPVTGRWATLVQIGGGDFPAQEGDIFDILVFVTDADLQSGPPFARPIDIPSVVHVSQFIRLTVGPRTGAPPALSITPSFLDFDCVEVGSSEEQTFTVTNTSSDTLTGSAMTPSPPFSIVSGEDVSLASGASQTVTVRLSPLEEGLFSDSLRVNTNKGVAGVGLLGGAGEECSLPPPEPNATILAPQDGEVITCNEPSPAECRFLVEGVASPELGQLGTEFNLFVSVTPIDPGGAGTFPQFLPVSVDPVTGRWAILAQIGGGASPAQEGDIFDVLVFITDTDLPLGPPFARPIDIPNVVHVSQFIRLTVGPRTGTPPALSIMPSFLDFDCVEVGSNEEQTFTVTNTSGGTLTGSTMTTSPFFSIVSGGAVSLASGATQTVTVRLSPLEEGLFSDSLRVNTNKGVAGVGLLGGAGEECSLPPEPNATVLTPRDGEVITCNEPLPADCRFLVEGVASPELGQLGTEFNLFVSVTPIAPGGGGTFPQLPPVSVDPVTGRWATLATIGGGDFPAQEGDIFDVLVFVTDADLSPEAPFTRPIDIPSVVHVSQFIRLTVGPRTGTPPALSIMPSFLDFDCVGIGSNEEQTFTVTNTNSGTLTGSAMTTSPPFSIVSGGAFSLGAGASQTVTVRLSPLEEGLFSDSLRVNTNKGVAGVGLLGGAGEECSLPPPEPNATILAPQDGEVITCNEPSPAECRFLVEGVASLDLAGPNTPFNLFVSVTPIAPGGGGTFPQFLPVGVSPGDGEWAILAQIGGGASPAKEGDIFDVLVFITDTDLPPGAPFARPIDIPGVVYLSQFIRLTVGPR